MAIARAEQSERERERDGLFTLQFMSWKKLRLRLFKLGLNRFYRMIP